MKKRILSFGAVGVFNTILNILIFNILMLWFQLDPGISNFLSLCVSITVAFILSNYLVFGDRKDEGETKKRFMKFAVVNVFSLFVVHQLVLLYFVYIFPMPGELAYGLVSGLFNEIATRQFVEANTAKALAVLVSMIVNYVLYDKFVFKNQRHESLSLENNHN